MIFIEFPNLRPSFSNGIAYKQESNTVSIPTDDDGSFCSCTYECDFDEFAFYDLSTNDSRTNDYHSILINLLSTSSTFEIVLHDKNGAEYQLDNNDFGQFYNKGFNNTQKKKCGYVIDWKKVFQQTGINGAFYYTVTVNNFGIEHVVTSRKFIVMPFDYVEANDTFKIETENTGAILNGEDYRGMTWLISKRFTGRISQLEVSLDKTTGLNSNDEPVQVQDKITKSYILETGYIKYEVLKSLIENDLIASKIFITSYDVYDFEDLKRVEVDTQSIESGADLVNSKESNFAIKLQAKKVIIKRNIK